MPPLAGTKKRIQLGPVVALVLTAILSFVLMTVWSVEGDAGPVHAVRNVVQTIASPFQRVGSFVAMPFQAIGNAFANTSASTETLTTLEEENAELQSQLAELEEYRQENERLTALLELSTNYNLESTGARVIAKSSDSWNRTITINKGSSSGITIGMPVMGTSGLIGQTESVTATTATVRLITDEQSAVSVLLQNSRAEGVLTGSADGLLYIDYITTDTEVELGEAVVTSGLGGVYPSGITVGIVSRIEGEETDLYRTIVVTPLASFDLNEEVIVLTGDETEATPQATLSDEEGEETDDDASDEGTEETTDSISSTSSGSTTTSSSSGTSGGDG